MRDSDLLCGVPLVVLSVVATVSLAFAHLGHHSLAAVLATSLVLLLALAFAARKVPVRHDRAGLAVVLGSGLLAAVMFFPGFPYGAGDKDPGNYVAHGVQIARGGSYDFIDPALAHPTLPVEMNGSTRLSAVWVDDAETGRIVPQFFHLWPALFATAYDIGGYGGIVAMAPLAGVIAVMVLAGLLRRVGGVAAGAIGGALLATNMLEVWQAKYPSTEVFAQALYLGVLFAAVVAIQERRPSLAAVAGALVGVSFLNRADGWLLVILAALTLGALYASRLADRYVAWGAAGLALLLPYACWQAYDAARSYAIDNDVPPLSTTLVVLAAIAIGAVVVRLVIRRPIAVPPRMQFVAGFGFCTVVLGLLVVGFLRPYLFGNSYFTIRGGITQRSYDEMNLLRLSWFLSLPAFALAGLGVATVALRRWRTEAWAVVLATVGFTVLYAYHARVAARLMWWSRRYVPTVVPGLVMLVALALAFGVAWQWRGRKPLRYPAIAAAVALVAFYLSQSIPVRSHHEWQGTFGVNERLSALSGDKRGVYLFEQAPCCIAPIKLYGSTLWLARGELSVVLPADRKAMPGYVAAYRKAFPGDPVFVVAAGLASPVPGLKLAEYLHGSFPVWEEYEIYRPDSAERVPYDFTVWRVP